MIQTEDSWSQGHATWTHSLASQQTYSSSSAIWGHATMASPTHTPLYLQPEETPIYLFFVLTHILTGTTGHTAQVLDPVSRLAKGLNSVEPFSLLWSCTGQSYWSSNESGWDALFRNTEKYFSSLQIRGTSTNSRITITLTQCMSHIELARTFSSDQF